MKQKRLNGYGYVGSVYEAKAEAQRHHAKQLTGWMDK